MRAYSFGNRILSSRDIRPYVLLFIIAKNADRRFWLRISRLAFFQVASTVGEIVTVLFFVPFLAAISGQTAEVGIAGKNESELFLSFWSFAGIAIVSASIRAYTVWLCTSTASTLGNKVSTKAFRGVMESEYIRFAMEDSSKLLQKLTGQVGQYVNSLNAVFAIFSSTVLFVGMLITLSYFSLGLTFISGCIVFAIYLLINKRSAEIQLKIGAQMIASSQSFISVIQDAVQGIRDIRFKGSAEEEVREYSSYDYDIRINQCKSIFIGSVTRFPLELTGQLAVATAAIVLMRSPEISHLTLIPTLGGLALGVQKALPAAQAIFAGHSAVMSYQESIKGVHEEVRRVDTALEIRQSRTQLIDRIERIELVGVGFSYPKSSVQVHESVSLSIHRGDRVAIVGPSGSGKSTLLDIITGLLEPTEGRVIVNGMDIWSRNSRSQRGWQRNIAYVSQRVHIYKGDLKNNVIMDDSDKCDDERYTRLIETFGIRDLHKTRVSDAEDRESKKTQLSVSGGEAQRIGIARALYRKPDILVLDEPTNSLDKESKMVLSQELEMIQEDMGIILVTHDDRFIPSDFRVIKINKHSQS